MENGQSPWKTHIKRSWKLVENRFQCSVRTLLKIPAHCEQFGMLPCET